MLVYCNGKDTFSFLKSEKKPNEMHSFVDMPG